MKQYSIAVTILAAIVFDLLLASNAVAPLRLIYDVSFAMVVFPLAYISILLIRNKDTLKTGHSFTFPKVSLVLPLLLNLQAVLSIVSIDIPSIGFLNSNVLIQGLSSILPVLSFSLLSIVNGVVLCIAVKRKNEISAYELPTYALCMVAIETFLAIYAFNLGGITGIRLCLLSFHLGICGAVFWLQRRLKTREIRMNLKLSDALLFLLSIGILMMVFTPFGIYNIFGDSSVVVGSALSIAWRGSLQPYYVATSYYSSIGGFVSIIFAYSTGLNNILSASNLPFLASYLALPYVTYSFLKKFVTSDSRFAMLGAIASTLMDGLAILLFPLYGGNLTNDVIIWQISPVTKSLYSSTVGSMWLTPYKTFGMASAIAAGSVLERKSISSLLLAGALIASSFANPRQPFVAILIFVFLWGVDKVKAIDISAVVLSLVLFLGPIFLPTVRKTMDALLLNLHLRAIVPKAASDSFFDSITSLTSSPLMMIMLAAVVCALLALIARKIHCPTENKPIEGITKPVAPRMRVAIKFKYGKLNWRRGSGAKDTVFWGLAILVLAYAIFNAYQVLPPFLTNLQDGPFAPLNYLVLRHHILAVLIAVGFLTFITRKHTLRILIAAAILAIATYLGLTIDTALEAPIIVVAMSLPALSLLVNSGKKKAIFLIVSLIFLGVFSGCFYSATVKSMEPDYPNLYEDLPHVLQILMSQNPDTKVYTISSYDYFVNRVVWSMATLKTSSDPSCHIYIIDTRYTQRAKIESLLNDNNSRVLYQGQALILLERTK
jgi:hypothetical protein